MASEKYRIIPKISLDIKQAFELADDILITSVNNLRQDIRNQILCKKTDFIITRLNGRVRSLVIEREVAQFLESFRKPITFEQAMQSFLLVKDKEMGEFMEDIAETINQIYRAGFLRKADSSFAINPGLSLTGQILYNYTILGFISSLDETEIYQCKSSSDQLLALKIAKYKDDIKTNNLLEREYSILALAPHLVTPQPHRTGNYEGRYYLLMDWCEGTDILTAANQIRKSSNGTYPFLLLKELVVRLLRSYEQLHESGIIHGDIHPKNCIYNINKSVKIIDFGFASAKYDLKIHPLIDRPGVPYFYDPSFALSILNNKKPQPANISSDLYGLAALSFLLLTGYHYLPFRFNRKHFFKQISLEHMRSFESIGIPSWPTVEAILCKALSKEEKERFASVKAFADALEEEVLIKTGKAMKINDPATSRISINRFTRKGLDFDWKISAPFASFHCGAAGLAYTLLKCAQKDQDAELLIDADVWIAKAKSERMQQLYIDEPIGVSEKLATPHSLHYGQLGVCLCEVLIASARWDYHTANESISEICQLALNAPDDFDLMSGKAGGLLACCLLLEAIPNDPLIHSKPIIIETGQSIVMELIEKMKAIGKISTNNTIYSCGMAHGWAGLLYSLLRWAQVTRTTPHIIVKEYLHEMANLSKPSKVGRWWPDRIDNLIDKEDNFSASWCRGASGFVHLFGLAYEIYDSPYFLDNALAAADYTFSALQNGATLCCGDAGIAYAQLYIFRLTKEALYLERAKTLTNRASNVHLQSNSSLYKGNLGLHFLTIELMNPEEARMPLF